LAIVGTTFIDMKASDAPLAEQTLGGAIGAIASEAVAPGAGAAGAIALALAASCAAKAVAITLKHRGLDTPLASLHAALVAFSERALAGGDDDAARFKAFMRDENPETTAALIDEEQRLQRSAATLKRVLDRLAAEVDSAVLADLHAARALCGACLAIQSRNLEANQRA
jgi:formiminotetrahydrofolate cyclodeaminase